MFAGWASDKQGRVATAYGITNDGTIYQCFDPKFWAYALYVNSPHNLIAAHYKTSKHDTSLNSRAVQVEICNWGALEKRGTKFYSWPAKDTNNYSAKYEVAAARVITYDKPFKGSRYYEKYTEDEIKSLEKLIRYHHEKDGIPLDYHENMWQVNDDALNGTPGIWTHVSYRTDKSDAHPQPELIQMLKGLK